MSRHKRPEVDQRLARIEGHVRSIRKMLVEERAYPEIVRQVSAVRASLDSVVEVIVEDIVEDCVATSRKGERVNDLVLELKQVVANRS
jgi:CsoR family transcriptional regulator, copper-sensing transcriptional repressor